MDRFSDQTSTIASASPGAAALVAGRYEIRARLGRGATKEVYRAYDQRLDREVALAIVVGGADDQTARARVAREAQVTGRLGDHPHVITVYDTGEHSGVPYLVLRAMDGGSLADAIAAARPTIEVAVRLGREIAAALAHAHAHGIVHRDVKPDNVWLAADGTAALGDFGIAKRAGAPKLTAEGVVLGSVRYLSPEQITGRDAGSSSDLYALGVTLYELVCGCAPFDGADATAVLAQHLNASPAPPSRHEPSIPEALERLIMQLLAKDPAHRPASASLVEQELVRIAGGGVAAAQAQSFALPPILAGGTHATLEGRQPALDRLWHVYERAAAGAMQIAMLRGDPGIGKTRLATEIALRAHAHGAVVLYGRCDEEPLLPHQPFVEALRHYVHHCPLPELARQAGRGSGELRRLVPELAERLPDLAEPMSGDPEGERFRLFEALSALLAAAADARPMVLVLDDLHWADKPTLLALRHLARYARDSRLLVVGTYRLTEVDARDPLSAMLADLSREHSLERFDLESLDRAAVTSIVRAHAGRDAPQLVGVIFEETEGNPFFVVEMLRHLAESSATDLEDHSARIPEGVKDVIGRRIARLGTTTGRVLQIASVSGRDFELDVLAAICELGEDDLVEALEHAMHAHVIEEAAGVVGRYTFSHALIRETIYGELSATRRALLHRRVAASLEEAHRDDLEPFRAELAYHLVQGGSAGDLAKAIEYSARAGDRAAAQLAYEQAALNYRRAASLIGNTGDQVRRCDLLIAQGEAERRAGDPAYRDTLLQASHLADERGDAERLARSVIANSRGYFSSTAGVDRERVAVLRAALDAHGGGSSATRASLLAQLAVELVADPDWRQRIALSDEALSMARGVGDPKTLLRTLNYRYAALWGPRTLAERLSNSREAHELADSIDDPILAFYAAYFGFYGAAEAGDLALADQHLQRVTVLAEQLGQPTIHWYLGVARAKRSTIAGSLDEAERVAYDALSVGRSAGQPDAVAWFANQLLVIRFLQGELGSDRPNFLKAAAAAKPFDAAGGPTTSRSLPMLVEAQHLVCMCEVGRAEEVRGRFDELMRDGLATLPHDWAALAVPALASVTCSYLADRPRAAMLHAALEPHSEQFVDTGPSWFGATTHHLAVLAATLGYRDEADARFAEAIARYRALGADAWLARALDDQARTA